MRRFESGEEYEGWVREIAETVEESGEPPEFAAKVCISDQVDVGEERTVLTVGRPFVDERACPMSVLRWSDGPRSAPIEAPHARAAEALGADIRAGLE